MMHTFTAQLRRLFHERDIATKAQKHFDNPPQKSDLHEFSSTPYEAMYFIQSPFRQMIEEYIQRMGMK